MKEIANVKEELEWTKIEVQLLSPLGANRVCSQIEKDIRLTKQNYANMTNFLVKFLIKWNAKQKKYIFAAPVD